MSTNNSVNNSPFGLIQTQTATSSTALTFTTGITSAYNNYYLLFDSVTNAAAITATYLFLQLSTDGGSTYISTGYTNAEAFGPLDGGLVLTTLSFSLTYVASGNATFNNLTSGSAFPMYITNIVSYDPTSSGGGSSYQGNYNVISTVVNAFQLVTDDGSAFSGNFSLYSYGM